MLIKKLNEQEIKKLAGYIYVFVEKRKNENTEYIHHDVYFTDLSRLSKPLILEDQFLVPYFQILQMGGGMKPLEEYQTDMVVADNSSAIFTSQSATKVFRDVEDLGSAKYKVNLEVGKNSFVEYINDSVILYESANFQQTNNFYLNENSTLFYTEIFSSGYAINHVRHAYNLMQFRTNIYKNNKLIVYDNLVFQPKKEDPNGFSIMDNFERCGSGYFVNDKIDSNLINELKEEIKQFNSEKRFIGVSSLDVNGISLRILANEVYEIEEVSSFIHNWLRNKLFNQKPLKLRKQ